MCLLFVAGEAAVECGKKSLELITICVDEDWTLFSIVSPAQTVTTLPAGQSDNIIWSAHSMSFISIVTLLGSAFHSFSVGSPIT